MNNNKIERIKGTSDVLPEEQVTQTWITRRLEAVFESFGYCPISVPIIEYTDLYLRKSGEDTVSRLYDFAYKNRRLSLRPDMAASMVRAYINNMQSESLPVRLYGSGPVFRYEKPQKERSRQFTQISTQLLGSAYATADAETIFLACKGLESLDIREYHLVIGHVGLLSAALQSIGLEARLQSFLLANMKYFREYGKEGLMHHIFEVFPSLQHHVEEESPFDRRYPTQTQSDLEVEEHGNGAKIADYFGNMELSESRSVILDLLLSMGIRIEGSRSPSEIVDRLLHKMKQKNQNVLLDQALELMDIFNHLRGDPEKVLQEASFLISKLGIDQSLLDNLKAVLTTLEYYGLTQDRICLDLGLVRGLQYYTGMIFEIHSGSEANSLQICGGGRYDDLATVLGSVRSVPAIGFSYGLERIRHALNKDIIPASAKLKAVDALVIPVSLQNYRYAVNITEKLREQGFQIEIDVRARSVKSNLRYADKIGTPFIIIVGDVEEANGIVTLRNMFQSKEQRSSIEEVCIQIQKVKQSAK